MNQSTLDLETPLSHLHHRDGPETEREALAKVDVQGLEQKVLFVIRTDRRHGSTLKEICRALNKEKNSISGRITALQNHHHLIKETGRRREGCRVMVLSQVQLYCQFCTKPISNQTAIDNKGLCDYDAGVQFE